MSLQAVAFREWRRRADLHWLGSGRPADLITRIGRRPAIVPERVEAVSKLFMPPLLPENSGCKAQRAEHSGSMFKRCNTANAIFRGQPEGLAPVFAHFCVARRLFSRAKPRSSRLELHKNGHQREHE